MLNVKEVFYSIQGEGLYSGVPMSFIRLSGCNLNCSFCDTNYSNGSEVEEEDIVKMIKRNNRHHVCITGGEPTLQDLTKLISLLIKENKSIHLETNGTLPIPDGIDIISISPKDTPVLKENRDKASFYKILCGMDNWKDIISIYNHYKKLIFLQPLILKDEEKTKKNMEEMIMYTLQNKGIVCSLQIHKILNIK
jgi:organic radical activating enzyme